MHRRLQRPLVAMAVAALAGVLAAASPAQARCPGEDGSVPGRGQSTITVATPAATLYVDDRDALDHDDDGDAGGLRIYRESNGTSGLQRGGRWAAGVHGNATWASAVAVLAERAPAVHEACAGPPDTPYVWAATRGQCVAELTAESPFDWSCGMPPWYVSPISVHADTELDGRGPNDDDDDRVVTLFPNGIGAGGVCDPSSPLGFADSCTESSTPDELLF